MPTAVYAPNVANDIHAPRPWARVAGLCWLMSVAGGLFAEACFRARLIAHDPLMTIQDIIADTSSRCHWTEALRGG
jgi:hypothetical protein